MNKFIMLLTMVALIGAAIFGILNRSSYIEAQKTVTALENEYKGMRSTFAELETEKAGTEEMLKTVRDMNDQVKAELSQAKLELQRKESEVETLAAVFEGNKGKLEEMSTIKDKLRGRDPAQLKAQLAGLDDKANELRQQIRDSREQVVTLQNDVERSEQRVVELQDDEELRRKKVALNGMEAMVIAVNREMGFVIVNAGAELGVTADSSLLVTRGNDRIGRLRISSVEPSVTVADIVPGTLSPGSQIQVRDKVIFENVRTN